MSESLKESQDNGNFLKNDLPYQNGYWKIWFSWVVANTLGFVSGLYLVMFLISLAAYFVQVPFSITFFGIIVFFGAIGGVFMGYFQSRVLRSNMQQTGSWVTATAISWGLSFLLFFHHPVTGATIILTSLLSGIVPAIMGAIVGLFQWFVIRNQSKWAGLWILSNIIGYSCGFLIARFFVSNTGLSSSIIIVIWATIISMMTGIGFVFLFNKSQQILKHVGVLVAVSLFIILAFSIPVILKGNRLLLKIEHYPVISLAFSPDGNTLASVSMEGEVKLWDVETGQEINSITAPTSMSACIAYSPDGRSIAIVTDDVRLWNLDTDQLGKPYTGVPWDDDCIGFSPDGKYLATMELHRMIIWDLDEHLIAKEFHVDEAGNVLQGLAFSSKGDYLVGNQCATLYIWNIETGQEVIYVFPEIKGYIGSVDISPDGKIVVIGSHSLLGESAYSIGHSIRFVDISTGIEEQSFGTRADVEIVRYSPDGTKLAVVYFKHPEVEIFDVMTGQLVRTIKGHRDYVDSIAFSPDGNILASAAWDGTIRIWDVSDIYNASQ